MENIKAASITDCSRPPMKPIEPTRPIDKKREDILDACRQLHGVLSILEERISPVLRGAVLGATQTPQEEPLTVCESELDAIFQKTVIEIMRAVDKVEDMNKRSVL